jgi:DNA-binding CsgD family transcriptional regulator
MKWKVICTFLLAIILSIYSIAQTVQDVEKWTDELNLPYTDSLLATDIVWQQWSMHDASYCSKALSLLIQKEKNQSSKKSQVQVELLKAKVALFTESKYENEDCSFWAKSALQKATELDDEHLMADACAVLGNCFFKWQVQDEGLFYYLKCISLLEKLAYSKKIILGFKITTSSHLYSTENYTACKAFCKEILADQKHYIEPVNVLSIYNNLGLVYRATGVYDSAILCFEQAVKIAQQNRIGVWVGIAKGNVGDVLHLQNKSVEALPYWQEDVDSCTKYTEWENVGLTKAHMSEYFFKLGQQQKGLLLLQEAQSLVTKNTNDLLAIKKLKAAFFTQLKQFDSANIYLIAYHNLDKARNATITKSRIQQLQFLLNFDNNTNAYKLIRKEKEAETVKRNLLIGILLFSLLTAWLYFNRQRLKYKVALNEKQLAENEIKSANEQLELFTQTLLQKNEQIENLHQQLHSLQQTQEDELIHQTILTDADWNRFKTLFEKAHPQFFERLKKNSPDITAAEIRLAALIKLNLDNKQMASMQGISVSSIRGYKTRLRQRLQISVDNDLDQFVKAI